ncbi:hypothetical protein [Actinomadura sp. 3N407]|uniref:hypothetical protein n=1 Tax=Actinomadura sp. 3N407 TaxID=3457423 RepID=UPI003FCC38A7
MTKQFRPGGPHTPDDTRAAAAAIGEAARALNHATGDRPGLASAADVSAILGSLADAATDLKQVLEQCGQFLQEEAAAGQASTVPDGGPSQESDQALDDAVIYLQNARSNASLLSTYLAHARVAAGGLHPQPPARGDAAGN